MKFDPTYRFPPNFLAQFVPHLTLSEQIDQMNKHFRYQQAAALFHMPPKGNA